MELKLKRAQYVFGVNGLCDIVTDLKQRIESLKKKRVKGRPAWALISLEPLDKMVEQYKSEEHERRTYHAPEQKAGQHRSGRVVRYGIQVSDHEKVKHFADTVGMTVEDWTKWEFERVDSNMESQEKFVRITGTRAKNEGSVARPERGHTIWTSSQLNPLMNTVRGLIPSFRAK